MQHQSYTEIAKWGQAAVTKLSATISSTSAPLPRVIGISCPFLPHYWSIFGREVNVPVRTPFFSPGSLQLTLSEVSKISVKLRWPTAPGAGRGTKKNNERWGRRTKWSVSRRVTSHYQSADIMGLQYNITFQLKKTGEMLKNVWVGEIKISTNNLQLWWSDWMQSVLIH